MAGGHHREMKSSVRPPGCKLGSRSVWSLTGPRAPEARSLEAAPSLDEAVGSRSPDEGGCQPPKQCGTTQALVLRYLRSFFAPEAHREGSISPQPAYAGKLTDFGGRSTVGQSSTRMPGAGNARQSS